MNDPNGFVRHDNRRHPFHQWCRWGAVHGLKYWYHIVFGDLVIRKDMGVCLMPDQEDGYDNKGACSGSAMPIGGWVGNPDDGSVLMEIQGGTAQLRKLRIRLKRQNHLHVEKCVISALSAQPFERKLRVRQPGPYA
ncbi:MAG: hypothetical protein IJH78_08520 [Clostridia bacterium]|nr:hypothetical protein [Clostridia bacterium]